MKSLLQGFLIGTLFVSAVSFAEEYCDDSVQNKQYCA